MCKTHIKTRKTGAGAFCDYLILINYKAGLRQSTFLMPCGGVVLEMFGECVLEADIHR